MQYDEASKLASKDARGTGQINLEAADASQEMLLHRVIQILLSATKSKNHRVCTRSQIFDQG